MVAPTRHRYSLQDYLDGEDISVVRHEYLGGEIFARAGGTPEHAALGAAVIGILAAKLRGTSYRPYSSDLRLRVQAGLATYPDAAVICGTPERDPASPTHVTNPIVIVEVLSDRTEDYDRGEKREHYQQLESLREYVLIAQDRRRIEVFARTSGTWIHQVHGAGDRVELASIGVTIDVDTIYADAGVVTP